MGLFDKDTPLPPAFAMDAKAEDKNITIVLKERKPLFGRKSGHIIYEYMPGKYKFVSVENFKDVFKHKDLAYILQDHMGTWEDGKPFLLLKNRIPISLNTVKAIIHDEKKDKTLKETYHLCYDPKSFYTCLDFVQMRNLNTKAVAGDFWERFKWIILALIILAIVLAVGAIFFPIQFNMLLNTLFPKKAPGV